MKRRREIKVIDSLTEYIKTHERLPWSNGLISDIYNKRFQTYGNNRRPYSGLNALLTALYIQMYGWDSDQFLTFEHISKLGYSVKAGEREHVISFPVYEWRDEEGNVVPNNKIEIRSLNELFSKNYSSTFLYNKLYGVFNLAQTNKPYEPFVKLPEEPEKLDHEKNESCEKIVTNYKDGPAIEFKNLSVIPSYTPSVDKISIPDLSLFKTPAFYYSTLFHEMGHSTGHAKRLNRKFSGHFGSSGYAKEELVAELTSAILMELTGYDETDYIGNHSAYLQSWSDKICGDNFFANLQHAYPAAMRSVNHILGLSGSSEEIIENANEKIDLA